MYSDEQETHGLLTLHYGKHHATIIDEIKTCFSSENFADMTFICDDKTVLSAHKLIMASASPLVRRILGESVHANGPSVVLIPGIKSCHLRHLLDFLYHGQACIKVRFETYPMRVLTISLPTVQRIGQHPRTFRITSNKIRRVGIQ